eukprot:COSAG02_NODE_53258_length_303_cov_0.549020_1_plen_101_part_11
MDNLAYDGSVAQFLSLDFVRPRPGSASDHVDLYNELFGVAVRSGGGPDGCNKWCLNAAELPQPHNLTYNTRAYLNPATKTGPAPTDLLQPIVLRLRVLNTT